MKAFTLAEVAEQIGAELHGDGSIEINSIGTLQNAKEGQVSFLSNSKYRSQLAETKASAVIISEDDLAHCPCAALVLKNSYVGYAKVAQLLDSTPNSAEAGIAASAVVADCVTLGKNVAIGANAVIETGVVLGDDVQIGPNCFIGKGTHIGARTKLWSNISVYHDCVIGADCVVQANTVIGSDGFGYANDAGKWVRIPQLGRVLIGDNVEIGASTTIDRGALEDTVINDGVILDNQIQIAHNVELGEYTAMAACSVIAGSTKVGKHCVMGGLVGVNGHITLTDGVTLTGRAMVMKSIKEPGVYSSGVPSLPNREWRKNMVGMRHLDTFNKRLKALEAEASKGK